MDVFKIYKIIEKGPKVMTIVGSFLVTIWLLTNHFNFDHLLAIGIAFLVGAFTWISYDFTERIIKPFFRDKIKDTLNEVFSDINAEIKLKIFDAKQRRRKLTGDEVLDYMTKFEEYLVKKMDIISKLKISDAKKKEILAIFANKVESFEKELCDVYNPNTWMY